MRQLFHRCAVRLASLCRLAHLLDAITHPRARVMLWKPDQSSPLAALSETIGRAEAPTVGLFADAMVRTGTISAALPSNEDARRVRSLIEAEAWTDAALELLAVALPGWSLVRLARDDDEWCCTLARHWQLPDWLGETVETRHVALPLAILAAVVEASEAQLEVAGAASSGRRGTVPACGRNADAAAQVLCCDNFI